MNKYIINIILYHIHEYIYIYIYICQYMSYRYMPMCNVRRAYMTSDLTRNQFRLQNTGSNKM